MNPQALHAIATLCREVRAPDPGHLDEILAQAEAWEALDLSQVAALLAVTDPEARERVCAAAGRLTTAVFGTHRLLFAPLYTNNTCVNDCLYCGFRRSNATAVRRSLSLEHVVAEARALRRAGHVRVLLVAGEDLRDAGPEFLSQAIRRIREEAGIPSVSLNVAPLGVDDLRRLREAGASMYQCFQETYDPEAYGRLHPAGPKRRYAWRVDVLDRALEAGFPRVGMGALLGLADYRFDVLALVSHARRLQERWGPVGLSVSVPRLRPAPGAALREPPRPVDDAALRLVVAVYRLALPHATVTVSTREAPLLRETLLRGGANQVSAGARTWPGAYADLGAAPAGEQFEIADHRSLADMVSVMEAQGLLPNLCTACEGSPRCPLGGAAAGACDAAARQALEGFHRLQRSPRVVSPL